MKYITKEGRIGVVVVVFDSAGLTISFPPIPRLWFLTSSSKAFATEQRKLCEMHTFCCGLCIRGLPALDFFGTNDEFFFPSLFFKSKQKKNTTTKNKKIIFKSQCFNSRIPRKERDYTKNYHLILPRPQNLLRREREGLKVLKIEEF